MKQFGTTLILKHAVKGFALVATFALGTMVMHADTINFSGSSAGDFSGAPSSTASLDTLTYYGSTFKDTTSTSGFLAFGGNGVASTNNANNFGSFSLGGANATYSGNPFQLVVTFTSPAGISGGQTATFNAIVFGQVSSSTSGGVQVAFSPNNESYTFSNGAQSGSFTLNINNVSVNPGQTASVTGYILSSATSAVTPEPSSLMLLGTGLVSSAGMLFRRRLV